MSDTQTGDDAARAADATGPAAASAAVLAPPTRNPALSARNPALLSGRNPALSSRQRHDMRTASRARKMQAARRYGRYIPQDAIVRPETVVGIVSYNLPRKKSSHSYKLTPLGSVSPASAKFFDQAAKKRRSRTANSSTKRARSMPRRLQELHHGRQGGGASTAASAAELGRGMLRDGGFRPSTTTGTIGSAALVQSASMPAGSFLTGIDAGGPSRESPYNKSGTPFGGRPDTSLTQTSASSRPVTVTWADQSSSQAHSLGGALGHQRPSSPPPSFPGSTLRVHQEQHYDSDLDGSDLDEQDLESSLLSPAQLHSSMSQQERNAVKYFGLSGRDALFNHYKSVSTKRELRRDGVRTEFMYEVDRPRSPGRSYAENCLRLRMTPEPIHLRRVPTDRHLSLAHMGIGDRRLSALADSIGGLPGLHHLDVTDCRISDEAFVRLLENAEKRPADDAILSLKLSDNHIGHAGALGIADFLRHDITQKALSCHLTLLTLSNCQISDKVCSSICHAMVHNHTCTRLDISHNRLGIEAGSAIGEMLRVNSTLTDLDVSWNNIRGKGAGDIAFYLRGSSIRKLNMKMNVFGRCYAASMLGKWLPHTQVEYLDLSANHLTPLTVSILMNGLALFPTLKVVKLDENPLGMLGTSAVLRSFGRCHYDTGRTSSSVVSIWGCACDITSEMESVSQKKNATMESFDFHEPAGFYSLDLVKPADYALACEILYIANTRRRVDIKNCKYAMPVDTSKGKKPKFRQLKLVRSDGDKSDFTKSPPGFLVNKKTRKRWIVPEAGYINMMVKVRPQLPKEYDIVNPHVFNQVLKIIKEPHTDPNRMAIAHAACEGYIFSVGQVETILSTFSKSQAHALVPHFMLRLVANEETNNFIDKNRRFLSGSFARFYPQIPTGRYVLEMSDQADRALFKRLMEISNDERALEIKLKEKDDMSQKGDRSGFRNVTWKQEEFEVTGMIDEVEDVPRDGQIVLDFVSRNILKLDTPVTLTPETDDMTEEEKEARTIPAMPEECLSNIDAYCAWIHDKCVNVRWVRDFLIAKQPKPSDWMTLDQKITALFKLLDDDDGGEVDKMEVMKAIIERPEVGDFMCQIPELEPLLEPRTFGPAFDAIDQDGGGSLDLDEFRQMCGIATDIAEVAEAMFEADDDGDWDEGDDADLRAALKSLVGNKLNMAHKQLRQQMSNGTTEERLSAVRELFDNCDVGDKEYLMPEEFAQLTASLGIVLSASELNEAVEQIDEDGNGQIEVDEYLDWWGDDELIELYERQQEALEGGKPYRAMGQAFRLLDASTRLEKVQLLFDECDIGAKGYLMPWEFAKLSAGLGVKLSPSELNQAVEEIDEDGNGQIEVDEYLDWWSDPELIALYENQCDALEAGKPYRVMGDHLANGTALERLAVVRKLFDDCDDGSKEYLMPEEFGRLSGILGVKLGAAELKKAVEEIDEDGNGQIEVDEYLDWWGDPELIELYEEDPDRAVTAQNWCFAAEWLDSLGKEEVVIDRTGAGDKGRLANRDGDSESESDDDEGEGADGEPKKKKKKKVKPEDLCNRVNWIVVTLNRLVDLHKIHLLWDHLSLRENAEVLERLGWLTVFDPVSPERRFYMDLENREQRVVAACLVKLAIIEPGENWLYEGFSPGSDSDQYIPGWQLPVSWTSQIPLDGDLKLTYSSTAAGCAPVWDERVKLRRISLVPQDAPVPSMDDLIWGSESDKLMSYVGFVRLMQDPVHVLRTITKARRDLFDKKNRNEDEDESSEEEEEIDSDESGSDAGGDGGSEIGDDVAGGGSVSGGSALDAGVSMMSSKSQRTNKSGGVSAGPSKVSTVGDPTGSQTIKDVEGDGIQDAEDEEEQDWELLMPIDKYGRMAILLLEECRHNFLKSSKDNDDLEEQLSEEWVNFANLTKIRFEDHPDMRAHLEELGTLFDELGW